MQPLRGGLAPLTLASKAPTPWWMGVGKTPYAVYAMKGAGSQAASYVNLVQPGFKDLTGVAPPAWDATNGHKYNGTSHFLRTGITPVTRGRISFDFPP